MIPHVPIANLGLHWPLVEKGLLQILKRCPDTWTPKIVRHHLIRNEAALFADDSGFFITEVRTDPHSLARYLNVWCLYFKPGFGRTRKAELVEQIDQLTELHLCDTSQFSSPRSPWVRALEGYYEPYMTIYRRKKK